MIPKVIHYCWFGRNPLDERARKCIDSWRKYFPDYDIIQWDEDNFDVSRFAFAQEAYDAKKWAFVSDVARLAIIYEHGGIYFNTDVEVIRGYDDIISSETEGFAGFEKFGKVATGLGFGAKRNHPFVYRNLDVYQQIRFSDYRENLSEIACPIITTELLKKEGLTPGKTYQRICGMDIYGEKFFCPIDYDTGRLELTEDTHSIHWYQASWQDEQEKKQREQLQLLCRLLGKKVGEYVFGVASCVHKEGLGSYTVCRLRKIFQGREKE